MIYNRFTLITPDKPDVIIDEPMGYAEIVQGMIRDEDWGGVYFQATVNELGFYGEAAAYLMEQKQFNGLSANVVFLAESRCKEADPWAEELRGRLNFGRMKTLCGVECRVTMPVEQDGCIMKFRNRYDQAVDVDSLVAFDRITGLAPYSGLAMSMLMTPQLLLLQTKGSVAGPNCFDLVNIPDGTGGPGNLGAFRLYFRPTFNSKESESIKGSQLVPASETQEIPHFLDVLSPILLPEELPQCSDGVYNVNIRMKGSFNNITATSTGNFGGDARVVVWKSTDTHATGQFPVTPANSLFQVTYPVTFPYNKAFDETYTGSVSFLPGEGLYAAVFFSLSGFVAAQNGTICFDEETSVDITIAQECEPTPADVFLVNELLSRTAESATNNCIKVKSDYYGRTDSEPYASGVDGCGSLRVLTSGLKLRQADNAKMFISNKDLFDGLRAIDNIGMGFEPNPNLPGYDWLRIEPIEYFYQDFEVLRFPYAPKVNTEVDEGKHYSIVKVGYNKWEPQAVGGLDEFNSTREFRTSLETVRNQLDITSNLVAAGTVIEVTRQQSFVATGAADTTYDNDNFIVCVNRDVYGYSVEQGEITSPENIFSPATAYNFRITPLRNLMRWFKSIVNSYANITNSASKLFFSKGTGNYTAKGRIVDDCADENAPKAENIDLSIFDFKNQADYVPLVRPENINFNYPFTASDWSKVRANPNGYCSVQCGTGEWIKFFITELQWERQNGTAEIKGKIKW